MSLPSNLHFPDAVNMTQYLSNHALFKSDDLKKKEITKAIVELAVARFADSYKEELGVKIGTRFLIEDLKIGKDDFTKLPIPNLEKLRLHPIIWNAISSATERALIDCANSFKA